MVTLGRQTVKLMAIADEQFGYQAYHQALEAAWWKEQSLDVALPGCWLDHQPSKVEHERERGSKFSPSGSRRLSSRLLKKIFGRYMQVQGIQPVASGDCFRAHHKITDSAISLRQKAIRFRMVSQT